MKNRQSKKSVSGMENAYRMSHIRSKNTSLELTLRKSLWNKKRGYRVNYRGLPGTPDIVFTRQKVTIFCDSEFWHGKEFDSSIFKNTRNCEFWIEKIKRNIERDILVNSKLKSMGYEVIRFWGKDITSDVDSCVKNILLVLDERDK